MGVKVQVADVPVPVPYGSAFEGEKSCVRPNMRVEFGGKKSRAFEYLRVWSPMDEVQSMAGLRSVGPKFEDIEVAQGHLDLGIRHRSRRP